MAKRKGNYTDVVDAARREDADVRAAFDLGEAHGFSQRDILLILLKVGSLGLLDAERRQREEQGDGSA